MVIFLRKFFGRIKMVFEEIDQYIGTKSLIYGKTLLIGIEVVITVYTHL